jgi:DNA-binding IclR family transcriptional regulator
VVLTCIQSNESPTIAVRPGTHLELPNSPSARILKAFSSDTREDGTPFHDSYPEERHKFILAHYYDFEADTRGSGIGSIAAPVFDHNDQIVGTVAVVMPSTVLATGPNPAIVMALIHCAAQISSTMGSGAWRRKMGGSIEAANSTGTIRSPRKSRQAG